MSDHCGFKPFQDCNCGTECKSATARLAEINRKISTVQAKRRAGFALLTYAATTCITASVVSLAFVFFAVPDGKRQALQNQENVHVVQR
ncbi:hypothetical protein JZX87_09835 [Agrobacterium sp. Ap1]|uniref:hypothetical protein n=1 Tax=Agrobacterium sp. Ap1 TaxID=2815337 RepID=UPI001A8CE973|nr:hypothetical protein [Agrobacterium sp. Ap1]MBO0141462.1 hypothetical protein [Agrobacterium sp. Ap1]